MKHFAGWQAVYLSFFSPELYRDVVQNWRGIAFLYLFALILVVMTLQAVKLHYQVNNFAKQEADSVIRQFPKIKIESGELSFDKPSPYYVKDNVGKVIILFDAAALKDIKNPETGKPLMHYTSSPSANMTGKEQDVVSLSLDYERPLFVVGKKEIIFWDGKNAQVNPLTSLNKIEIDQSLLSSCVQLFRNWLGIIVFSLSVPVLFISHGIQVLLYGLIGKAFAAVKKVNLSYASLVRLSVVAITPVIVIDTALRLLDQSAKVSGFWPIVAVILALVYLFVTVNANAGSSTGGA